MIVGVDIGGSFTKAVALDLIVKKCDIVYCIESHDRPLRNTRYAVSLARSLGRRVYLIRL